MVESTLIKRYCFVVTNSKVLRATPTLTASQANEGQTLFHSYARAKPGRVQTPGGSKDKVSAESNKEVLWLIKFRIQSNWKHLSFQISQREDSFDLRHVSNLLCFPLIIYVDKRDFGFKM